MRFVVEGKYWRAGDNIYIDTQIDDCGYTVVCLNELIKNNIDEESDVTSVIDVKKKC